MDIELNSKDLLKPINMVNMYLQGAFPMANENNEIEWFQPETRTIIQLDNFNIPRSLNKFLATSEFNYKIDTDILEVIKNCSKRDETWISDELIKAYIGLINLGFLHSISVYKNDSLVGGLYGISYKGIFFGESMFSNVSQASKAALVYLLKHLKINKFVLIDVQYQTSHLKMFGTKEIDFQEYIDLLKHGYSIDTEFI